MALADVSLPVCPPSRLAPRLLPLARGPLAQKQCHQVGPFLGAAQKLRQRHLAVPIRVEPAAS